LYSLRFVILLLPFVVASDVFPEEIPSCPQTVALGN